MIIKNRKSTTIATVVAGAIVASAFWAINTDKFGDLQTYIGAVVLAQHLSQDISRIVTKVQSAGMFEGINDPDLGVLGKKYTAKIYYCPLPGQPLADIAPILSEAISTLDCRATTPIYRQVEIRILHQGKQIYNLPTAIVKHQ